MSDEDDTIPGIAELIEADEAPLLDKINERRAALDAPIADAMRAALDEPPNPNPVPLQHNDLPLFIDQLAHAQTRIGINFLGPRPRLRGTLTGYTADHDGRYTTLQIHRPGSALPVIVPWSAIAYIYLDD